MAIRIEQILSPTDKGTRAIIDHDGKRLEVEVAVPYERAAAAIGKSLMVELDYEEWCHGASWCRVESSIKSLRPADEFQDALVRDVLRRPIHQNIEVPGYFQARTNL